MKKYSQLKEDEQLALQKNFLQEPGSYYEKAEMDQLRQALLRTPEERFFIMTRLMKLNRILSKAKITHKPSFPDNKD
jgi:hypothetical protein